MRVRTPDYQKNSDFGWNSDYWQELGAPWGGLFSTPEDFAAGARAWHYKWDAARHSWVDEKDGHDLDAKLGEVVSAKIGRGVTL